MRGRDGGNGTWIFGTEFGRGFFLKLIEICGLSLYLQIRTGSRVESRLGYVVAEVELSSACFWLG